MMVKKLEDDMPNMQKLLGRLRASVICEDMRAEYPPSFDQELNYQCGRILFFASLITMVAWLPYIPLDRQLHPEEPLLPVIRAGLSAVSLIIFILYISRRFPERNLLFLNILGAYLAISCGLITALAKADPVYVGGNLFILTLLAVVPVKRRSVLIVLGASLATFFIVGYIKGMSFQTLGARYSLQDLMSVSVVAVIFVYLMDKKRYEGWLKSKKIEEQSAELKHDKEKIDKLLLNILPAAVARELKDQGRVKPVFFPSATIAFTDFVGFTEIAERLTPDQLVRELHELFTGFDRIMDKYGLEKLKTIGDAYMYAGGVPAINETHAIDAVLGALEIQSLVDKINREKASSGRPVFEIRIGMNSGPLMAGVVGEKKFVYDIWGDSVNLANRMESSGYKGKINISESTHILIKDYFETEARGPIRAKNKGTVEMYFVNRIKPEFSSDEAGLAVNERFRKIYGSLK
ncbi:MAG: adenylate/guanylate cyclase domain-containing protein [Deltaproteobacteria bacterium]|nr:adenylate/guanylate cyclase domain-containing protein [Deltaproteobacteria bacterium]